MNFDVVTFSNLTYGDTQEGGNQEENLLYSDTGEQQETHGTNMELEEIRTFGENQSLLEDAKGDSDDTELFENAIDSCGFGGFQYKQLLVTGWALASDSVEMQVVSFVLPSACDLEMTSTQKGWLNAIIFVGMMVGGYLFGGAADVKGRRYVLLWSMTVNGIFGFASAFAPSFDWFIFLRFLSGIGVGAAMPVIFAYFVEFMTRSRRGPMVGFLASFWMTGNILTCVLAWLVIPHVEMGGHINDLVFGSWRIFVALGAFPSLSSALLMLFMPESPLFLQKVGRYDEAKEVFVRMFRMNFGSKAPIPHEIKEFSEHYNAYTTKENESERISISGGCTFAEWLRDAWRTVRRVIT